MFSTTGRIPTSAQLSVAQLKICDNEPYAIRAIVDMWYGKDRSTEVSVNSIRIHSIQNVRKAKKVGRHMTQKVHCRTEYTDFVETGVKVDETFP